MMATSNVYLTFCSRTVTNENWSCACQEFCMEMKHKHSYTFLTLTLQTWRLVWNLKVMSDIFMILVSIMHRNYSLNCILNMLKYIINNKHK
jgi:hypothetical protein